MNEEVVKKTIREFLKSGSPRYKKAFSEEGGANIITITIERTRKSTSMESLVAEASNNTISALPSGTPCGCCGGSGKS